MVDDVIVQVYLDLALGGIALMGHLIYQSTHTFLLLFSGKDMIFRMILLQEL